jgi:ribosomal-protein-alanine N-acetyltransferase
MWEGKKESYSIQFGCRKCSNHLPDAGWIFTIAQHQPDKHYVMSNKYMKISLRDYFIRYWKKEDAPTIAKYANNRKIWLNLRDCFPHPYHLSDAEDFLARVFEQQPVTFFAIANEKEAIGSIGLMLGEDIHRYTAELGYWLAEPFWNKGIMTEVVSKFTDFAFERFELHRIFAEPYTNNTASVRVLEKSGFILEGTLRGNVFKNGKILDQYLYAKIRDEAP